MNPQRVVIVEDDPFTARLLTMVLSDAGYQVDVAHTGAAALVQIVARQTALLLLDVHLPDTDGYALLDAVRAARYLGPVIFMSGRHELIAKLEAFRHGADDYVVKPFEPLEFLARIDAVLRSTAKLDNDTRTLLVRVDDAELDVQALTYRSDAIPPVALAPTEMRLLDYLMRNAYVAVSRDTLNAHIWGADLYGDLNRVDVYVRRVRRRIEPDPERPRYLHTVRLLGYLFRPSPDGTPNDATSELSANQAATSDQHR